jgi:ribosomal protein S27E
MHAVTPALGQGHRAWVVGEKMSKFLRVKCACGNEQNIFGNASKPAACLVCAAILGTPSGSRVVVSEGTKVLKVL